MMTKIFVLKNYLHTKTKIEALTIQYAQKQSISGSENGLK